MPKPQPVKNVDYVLKRHKLSQRQLAKLMGCRVATVNAWAQRTAKISKIYLEKLRAVHEDLLRKEEEAKRDSKPPLVDL